jgi:hypothetical protein
MRNRVIGSLTVFAFVLASVLAFSSRAFTQGAGESSTDLSGPSPSGKIKPPTPWKGDPADLTGTWSLAGGGGGGQNNKDRLTSWSDTNPELTAEGQKVMASHKPSGGPRVETNVALENDTENFGNVNGLIRSLGYGVYGHEFFKLPDSTFHVLEWNHQWRRIWTDGRKMPDANVYGPYWYGYSIGEYTKDGLVVHTSLLDGRAWLDAWGTPMSDNMSIVEHWKRNSQNELQLYIDFNDPTIYVKPWTSRIVKYRPHQGNELQEAVLGPLDEQAFNQNIRVAGYAGNNSNVNKANDDLRKPGAR